MNDFSTYVRQAFLATLMEKGQGLVIETHHMQDGCMDVVEVDAIPDRFEAKFIGRPVTIPPWIPAPANHMVNP